MAWFNFFSKEKKETLDKGLSKTKEGVFSKLARAVAGKDRVDDEVLDNLEEVLITSDVGVDTTLRIIERIEERVSRDKYLGTKELNRILREEITALLTETGDDDEEDFAIPANKRPYVIMVVGVKLRPLVSWHINIRKKATRSIWELPIRSVPRLLNNWWLGAIAWVCLLLSKKWAQTLLRWLTIHSARPRPIMPMW